jgi:deoxyadenosine/deoxycytidine kinase
MIVSVDGAIGAGKSTLVRQLSEFYRVFEEPIEAWTLLEDFAKDPKNHAYGLQIEILISYYKLKKKIDPDDQLVIMERSPWSSDRVFFDMYIDCPLKRQTYNEMFDFYGYEPDLILFLDVDEETSWQRVQQRGRPQESGYTEKHVKNVVKKYKSVMDETTTSVIRLTNETSFLQDALCFISKHFKK